MKLTKGKISKLYNKKKQSLKKYKKSKTSSNSKTFRKKRNINLANTSMKRMYRKKKGGLKEDIKEDEGEKDDKEEKEKEEDKEEKEKKDDEIKDIKDDEKEVLRNSGHSFLKKYKARISINNKTDSKKE